MKNVSAKNSITKKLFRKFFSRKSSPIPPLQLYIKIVAKLYVCQAKWAYKQKKMVKKVVFSCHFRKKFNEEKFFLKKLLAGKWSQESCRKFCETIVTVSRMVSEIWSYKEKFFVRCHVFAKNKKKQKTHRTQ